MFYEWEIECSRQIGAYSIPGRVQACKIELCPEFAQYAQV